MTRRITSSTESDATLSEDSDYDEESSDSEISEEESEQLRTQIWNHFQLGHSKEEILIELCREMHEKEIDLDTARQWFQHLDEDAGINDADDEFTEDYRSLAEQINDSLQRFRTEISQWQTDGIFSLKSVHLSDTIDAFAFLNSRYAVSLHHHGGEQCQISLLDNFYGQKRKLQMNLVFTDDNEDFDSKLFEIDFNHLLLVAINDTQEHFDVCLLRIDFSNKSCKLVSSERVQGTNPELIFDYTNRHRFLLRFYDNGGDSYRMGRLKDETELSKPLEKVNPDLIVIMKHYHKKGISAKDAHFEINSVEGPDTVKLNTVRCYFERFQEEASELSGTENGQSTSGSLATKKRKSSMNSKAEKLRLFIDEDKAEFTFTLNCPRLVGNRLQTFEAENNEALGKRILVFGEYDLHSPRPQFKKLFNLDQIDFGQIKSLSDGPFYWSNNLCYTCHRAYKSGKTKLFVIDLEKQDLLVSNFYSLGYIIGLYPNDDGILTICVEHSYDRQLIVHRIALGAPDTLANLSFRSLRRQALFNGKNIDDLIEQFPQNLRPLTILASNQSDTDSFSQEDAFSSSKSKKRRIE